MQWLKLLNTSLKTDSEATSLTGLQQSSNVAKDDKTALQGSTEANMMFASVSHFV